MTTDWGFSSRTQTSLTRGSTPQGRVCRKYFLAFFFVLMAPALANEKPDEVLPATVIQSRSDAIVLDVRTPQEYALGHIDNAVNVNIDDEDFANRISELDPDRLYIVHCGANIPGGRAERALGKLQKAGFTRLRSLQGGYRAWINAGGVPIDESSR